MLKHIDLWYPNTPGPRTPDKPTEISVGLMHVRAADNIVIDYDFSRDGYRIRMRRRKEHPTSEDDCPLEEVAFVPSWIEPEEKQ